MLGKSSWIKKSICLTKDETKRLYKLWNFNLPYKSFFITFIIFKTCNLSSSKLTNYKILFIFSFISNELSDFSFSVVKVILCEKDVPEIFNEILNISWTVQQACAGYVVSHQ